MCHKHNLSRTDFTLAPVYAKAKDYVILLKPRVMSLVLFTALIGLLLAPEKISWVRALCCLLFIALGAGAAGALNMWYDADIDAIMKRTRMRPIPAGKLTPLVVFSFGFILALLSVIGLALVANWFAAAFLAFTIFFYIIIYTIFLKRRTPQNIVIGGAAGAFPPMVGYACVSGNSSLQSLALFLVIFLWTPPHFWALSLFSLTDYAAANIPMLPNIKGIQTTQNNILGYSIVMAISAFLPFWFSALSYAYFVVALILNIIFLYQAYNLWRARDNGSIKIWARKLFYFSLLYLFLLYSAILLEIIVQAWLK